MMAQFPGYEVVPEGARAGLIIVHGIAEHGGRYRHAAEALAARGIACFVYDQRGHGESPGVRTHVEDFVDFANDVAVVGAAVRLRLAALPLFVWGHSMGSIVVTLAAINGLPWARGVITTGCALDALPKLDGAAGYAMRFAAAIAPRLRINLRIDASALMQDGTSTRAYERSLGPAFREPAFAVWFCPRLQELPRERREDPSAVARRARRSGQRLSAERIPGSYRRHRIARQAAGDLPPPASRSA